MSKIKKIFFSIILFFLVISLLLVIEFTIQFYNEPHKEPYHINTTGYIVYGIENVEKELVSVEVAGDHLNYIFHNEDDSVEGDIWVNDCSLFGEDRKLDSVGFGFAAVFHEHSPDYAWIETRGEGFLCNMICLSKSWDRIVCGIKTDSRMGLKSNLPDGTPALLVIPAESPEELIEESIERSSQMKEWISQNMNIVN